SLGASVPPPEAPPPLDLAASGGVSDDERRTARDILLAGAALALFFGISGLVKSITYSYNARELYRYQKQLDPDIALSLNGMQAPQIDALLSDMQLQLGQLQAVIAGSRHLKISVVLKEIIDAMPDKLWIDHLTIKNDLAGGDNPFDVDMVGHVHDNSVADEQALAFNFKESLIRNPLLGKAFEISISVQKTDNSDAAPSAATDPKELADELEKRTQFELELKAKK
ncbi:MAG TPA: hypothetical protein VH309_11780, partial [Elusimicrobiota bacterium]|nr:hypothetical protein [Elusimicrobiota bacterium]